MESTHNSDRRVERYRALRSDVKASHPSAGENRIVRKGFTKLCIEGFPRSANSFFARAMALMNEPDYKRSHVAHHIHDVRNLELAVLAGVPGVGLIREPSAAIASAMIYLQLPESILVNTYLKFYQRLGQFYGKILIVDFEDVIGDMNAVVSLINQSFDCDYALCGNVDVLRDKVFKEIKGTAREIHNDGDNISKVGMPSEERKSRREELQAVVEKHPKFSVCSELYEKASEWTGVAVKQAWSKK